MVGRCLAISLCLSWLSACIMIPIPPEHQNKLADLDFLKVGFTKKAEVIEQLGAPSYALDAEKFLVYDDYSENWRIAYFVVNVAPGNPSGVGIEPRRRTPSHLVCIFDESGVLAEYEVSHDTTCRRYSTTAQAEEMCQLSRLSGPPANRLASYNVTPTQLVPVVRRSPSDG